MDAPVTKAPKLNAKLGELVEIPINTTGMKNISAITLNLKFDPTILEYQKTVYSDELMVEGAGMHNVVPEGPNLSEWRFVWSQIKPISQKPNESLLIIQFLCINKGKSLLTWDLRFNEDCEYADASATPLDENSKTYVDGYVKVS